MPGIVGLITRIPRSHAEQQLHQMVGAMRHEPSYVAGTWMAEDLGVYVGWVARRGSFSDQMPVCNERQDISLVFSGEEFPEPGAARRLKEKGHTFEEDGPSYLVHLYEENPAFLPGLNGWFHGLLTDRNLEATTLFNDRYGMNRVYYHQSKEAFYFAAEAKAILTVRPELRRVDPRGMGEFVGCGCVLENRTLFEGINVMPPASTWVFRNANLERRGLYFQPRDWENQAPLEPEAYYEELRQIFSQNLPRYFNGRERIGVSLTGGLDTRMIMAWQKSPPGALRCYSFGGMFRDCQDVVVARKVAQACGQPHEVIPVEGEFLSRFSHYAERAVYLTDACTAVNRSADLYLNERAREIAPVRMTGNYGSEVLRGVVAFKPGMPCRGLFRPEFLSNIDAAAGTYCETLRAHPLSFAVFRQAPWHHYGLLALEQTQVSLRSPYLDNDFIRTVFRAPRVALTNNDISLRLIADGDGALRRIRTDRGVGGNGNRLYGKASRRLLEFTAKAEYAYDYGMPQWVAGADHFLSSFHLERFFLGRHKFAHFRVWYRDTLSKYVRQMLLDSRTLSRPYLNPSAVEAVVHNHVKGVKNYTTEIHQLLTLELLHRLFLDSR